MRVVHAVIVVGVGVGLLAVGTVAGGPAGNATVYGQAIDVRARVVGLHGLDVEALSEQDAVVQAPTAGGDAVLVLIPDREVALRLDDVVADLPVAVHVVTETGTAQGVVRLRESEAAVLSLTMEREIVWLSANAGVSAPLPLGESRVRIPLGSEAGRGALLVTLDVREQSGDERGVPGEEDIADEWLPRPAEDEVLPTLLGDGRPVWVVGLPDTVAVVDARSPHRPSGLLGWCPASRSFIDSPGASHFDPSGAYRGGPAPWGLTPYQVEVDDEVVRITGRLTPPPRLPVTSPLPPTNDDVTTLGSCEPEAGAFTAALLEGGGVVEDYRSSPGWVQHDLAMWPRLGSGSNGWFRANTTVDRVPGPWQGQVVVRVEHGRIVDVAPPPGTAIFRFEP